MGTAPNHLLFQRPPGVYVICCVMSLVVTSLLGGKAKTRAASVKLNLRECEKSASKKGTNTKG